ncbi:MAG: hypothetical protein RLZZ196_3455 [Bacteroidota bacterium]|jgi:hypothetical protein
MTNTIGFFGDSFCADKRNHHSFYHGYETYIAKLSKHYDAKIVNYGHGGTGVWDTLLLQLDPLIKANKVPDICVFVWSLPARIFNRKVRRLNQADALYPKLHTYNPLQSKIWKAAAEYYKHLLDWEKEELEYIAALRYIDDVVLPKLEGKKIVHLWSTGKTTEWSTEGARPSNITYLHNWKHGVEIRPALLSLSMYDSDISVLQTDHRCNHLDGEFKNKQVYDWIVFALETGNNVDFSTSIDKLYDKSQEVDHRAI